MKKSKTVAKNALYGLRVDGMPVTGSGKVSKGQLGNFREGQPSCGSYRSPGGNVLAWRDRRPRHRASDFCLIRGLTVAQPFRFSLLSK